MEDVSEDDQEAFQLGSNILFTLNSKKVKNLKNITNKY